MSAMVTADDLYRWRGETEQLSAELLTAGPDERAAIRKRLDKLADEFFEQYLEAQHRRVRAPHGIAKCGEVKQ